MDKAVDYVGKIEKDVDDHSQVQHPVYLEQINHN